MSTQLPWADIASLTMGGFAPGYKESNQDSCFVYSPFGTPRQLLLGVMDGHGFEGHWVSNLARKHLPAAVFNGLLSQTDQQHDSNEKDKRQLHSKRSSTTDKVDGSGGSASSSRSGGGVQLQAAPAALVSMWESAFQRVDDLLAHSGVDVSGSGSTAVVVHVSGTRLTTAWVGDSRAVMAWRTMQPPPPPTTASSAVSWLARLLSGGGGAAESDASSYASSSYVYTPSARGSAWSHPLDLRWAHTHMHAAFYTCGKDPCHVSAPSQYQSAPG